MVNQRPLELASGVLASVITVLAGTVPVEVRKPTGVSMPMPSARPNPVTLKAPVTVKLQP